MSLNCGLIDITIIFFYINHIFLHFRLGLLVKDTALGDVETLPKFQDLGSTSGDGAVSFINLVYTMELCNIHKTEFELKNLLLEE